MVNASLMSIIGCAIFGLIVPVLGLNQYSLEVLHQSNIAFAHEAPIVYDNTLYFVSNILQDRTIQLNSFNLVTKRFSSNIQPSIPMPNGAITTCYGTILFCAQGNMTHPSGIYEFNPTTNVATPILTGWNGFQFNSPNDLVLEGGVLSFTDPSYGFIQGFRPKPLFKGLVWNASYRWDGTRSLLTDVSPRKEVFQKPNGITTWGGKLYVSDTGYFVGNGTIDAEIPRAIYELDNGTRKIFALVNAGAPDGIKVYNDQLYAGCGDGVRIYSKKGELVNTIKVEGGVANFVIHENWIYMMNEKLLLRARLQ